MILHATWINSIQFERKWDANWCTKVIEYHIASHFHDLCLEKIKIKIKNNKRF